MMLKDVLPLSAVAAENFLDSDDQQCANFDPAGSARQSQAENFVERIIGGQEIDGDTAWPWMVSIANRCWGWEGPGCNGFLSDSRGKGAGHSCGGSLVFDGQYVLTAAHCIQEPSFTTGNADPDLFINMEILYGANNLNNADQTRIIASVIHPDFHPSILSNDIALLKLAEPVVDATKVACIPTTNYNLDDSFPDGNTEAFAAGWGVVLQNGQFQGPIINAREVKVPIVDDHTCETIYEQVKIQFDYDTLHNLEDDQTICAGFEDGLNDDGVLSDGCQGDSGGPLVRKVDGFGYSLIGLTSWGYGCATTFGVYTQVGPYAEWIQEAKAALDDCMNNKLCLNQDKVDSGACGGGTGDCGLCFIDGEELELPEGCRNCKDLRKGKCEAEVCKNGEVLPAGCPSCKKLLKGKCDSSGGGGGSGETCNGVPLPADCKNCKKFNKGKCGGGSGEMCGNTPLPAGCKNCKKFNKGKC